VSCQLPHALLRIFSHGRLDRDDCSLCPDPLLLFAPLAMTSGPKHHIGAFNFENQSPTDGEVLANLRMVLFCAELLSDKLVADAIYGN
jgi:hypothetical protein